ncbi:unnamed protein product [Nezara viridula]|uniref:Uncharacterized protein n=1 Tax=Nezara viridula TaxID=85310 RepID=A0A9P0MX97_NEZVI|nr:unnamed protein product [Nezara viridula]
MESPDHVVVVYQVLLINGLEGQQVGQARHPRFLEGQFPKCWSFSFSFRRVLRGPAYARLLLGGNLWHFTGHLARDHLAALLPSVKANLEIARNIKLFSSMEKKS